ncbi:4Fe-4S binding protein [Clostridium massiliamazoniense]|uniref:4Fe-4S binding protein n=1 Tax=Clostridium massiliamazoniense TaxID=1347366 RepID=UPI0006D8515C|nr:4Fe-4S binding protein [Clostridium massiliamazoniense]
MKKNFKLQYLRVLCQIFFFIFYPGLFALAFAQIGNVVSSLVTGKANKELILINILLGIILIGLSIVFGRFFCGWMCSFGAMNDLFYYISKKLFKFNFVISERIDNILKWLKYLILLFIIICFWILGMSFANELNPWKSFAEIAKFPPSKQMLTVGLIFLVIIIIGSMLIERFFCRYLCPLGAIFTLFSKFKITNIYKERSVCGKCKACTATCSMGLALYKENKVKEVDCISCLKCVDTCPKKNVNLGVNKKTINAVIITSIFLVLFFILYFIKNSITTRLLKNYNPISSNNNFNIQKNTNTIIEKPSSNVYKDGIYYGTARGYKSNIEVKVTVKNNKITAVNVVSIDDTVGYYEEAVQIIPKEILNAQSPAVDAVAGATQSSMGIIDATKKALIKAIGGGSENSNKAATLTSMNSSNNGGLPAEKGTTTVGDSTATVEVTLSGEMIENIKVLELNSDEKNAQEAKSIIPQEILSSQSTNVASVSGAKNASEAIIKAVNQIIDTQK